MARGSGGAPEAKEDDMKKEDEEEADAQWRTMGTLTAAPREAAVYVVDDSRSTAGPHRGRRHERRRRRRRIPGG
jgi:hypothetical protein